MLCVLTLLLKSNIVKELLNSKRCGGRGGGISEDTGPETGLVSRRVH